MGFRVSGLGFRVWGEGCKVSGDGRLGDAWEVASGVPKINAFGARSSHASLETIPLNLLHLYKPSTSPLEAMKTLQTLSALSCVG